MPFLRKNAGNLLFTFLFFFSSGARIKVAWTLQDEHLMSTLLHPSLRQCQASPTDRVKALDLLKQQLLKRGTLVDRDVNAQPTSAEPKITTAANSTPSRSLLVRCFDQPKPVVKTVPSPTKELDDYMSMDFQLYETDDVLSFWKTYSNTFPSLSSLARDLFAIPAANTSIERLFSASKNTVTERRTRLGADKLNKLLFLQKNRFSLSRTNERSCSADRVHSKRSLSTLNNDEISLGGHEESSAETSAKKPREDDDGDDYSSEIGDAPQADTDELMS